MRSYIHLFHHFLGDVFKNLKVRPKTTVGFKVDFLGDDSLVFQIASEVFGLLGRFLGSKYLLTFVVWKSRV